MRLIRYSPILKRFAPDTTSVTSPLHLLRGRCYFVNHFPPTTLPTPLGPPADINAQVLTTDPIYSSGHHLADAISRLKTIHSCVEVVAFTYSKDARQIADYCHKQEFPETLSVISLSPDSDLGRAIRSSLQGVLEDGKKVVYEIAPVEQHEKEQEFQQLKSIFLLMGLASSLLLYCLYCLEQQKRMVAAGLPKKKPVDFQVQQFFRILKKRWTHGKY